MEMTLAITPCVTWMANEYKFMGKDFITGLMTGGGEAAWEVGMRLRCRGAGTDEHGRQQAKALVFLFIMYRGSDYF